MSEKEVVIVTGSSGLIGSALIENLAGHFALAGFDKVTLRLPPPAAECVCIDLTSEDAVNSAFERVRIAYGTHIASVIHLAAYYDLTGEPSPLYERITVRGTERLLRHLKHFIVEQFVFTSTMLVHAGAKPGQSINEGSPLDPTLPYPESKILTERLIEEQHDSIPAVILRLAGVYDDIGRLAFLAHQIAGIYERRFDSFVYPGNLATGQSALHLDDLTNALRLVIDRRKELPPHSVLLLGEPEAFSFDEIQRTVGKLTFVFGMFGQNTFSDAVLHVTQERHLWDPILRNTALIWSDLASGLLIMLLGALSLSPRLSWAQWANTLVGIWLLFAPLVFWSPSAAVYANDTARW
jgi:nucleoside-diphosphate-sugar epimerase